MLSRVFLRANARTLQALASELEGAMDDRCWVSLEDTRRILMSHGFPAPKHLMKDDSVTGAIVGTAPFSGSGFFMKHISNALRGASQTRWLRSTCLPWGLDFPPSKLRRIVSSDVVRSLDKEVADLNCRRGLLTHEEHRDALFQVESRFRAAVRVTTSLGRKELRQVCRAWKAGVLPVSGFREALWNLGVEINNQLAFDIEGIAYEKYPADRHDHIQDLRIEPRLLDAMTAVPTTSWFEQLCHVESSDIVATAAAFSREFIGSDKLIVRDLETAFHTAGLRLDDWEREKLKGEFSRNTLTFQRLVALVVRLLTEKSDDLPRPGAQATPKPDGVDLLTMKGVDRCRSFKQADIDSCLAMPYRSMVRYRPRQDTWSLAILTVSGTHFEGRCQALVSLMTHEASTLHGLIIRQPDTVPGYPNSSAISLAATRFATDPLAPLARSAYANHLLGVHAVLVVPDKMESDVLRMVGPVLENIESSDWRRDLPAQTPILAGVPREDHLQALEENVAALHYFYTQLEHLRPRKVLSAHEKALLEDYLFVAAMLASDGSIFAPELFTLEAAQVLQDAEQTLESVHRMSVDQSLNGWLVIGIVVGGLLTTSLLMGLAILAVMKCHRRKKAKRVTQEVLSPTATD